MKEEMKLQKKAWNMKVWNNKWSNVWRNEKYGENENEEMIMKWWYMKKHRRNK